MDEAENQTSTTDIIDATQNAVIDAVNSVSQIIEKKTDETPIQTAPKEAFYLSAEFWVGVAFVLAVAMIFKPVFSALKNLLIKRREKIINTLSEAEDLRFQAQKLLADYERKYLQTENEVALMVQKAKEEVRLFAFEKNKAMEKDLFKKQAEAKNAIETAIATARLEMRKAVAEETLKIVKTYINENMDEKRRSDLIDDSIQNIVEKL